MDELLTALNSTQTTSTPGAHGITKTALRNLSESGREDLLTRINFIWESSNLPDDWKES